MTQTLEPSPFGNPFAASRIRPEAREFIFAPGETAERLIERFFAAGARGEIVGPHGTGKSTLLETLLPLLAARGAVVARVTLHNGQRRLPRDFNQAARAAATTLLVIDGYEQLSWISRARLAWRCRRQGIGLLVSAHRATGLPRLATTSVDPPLAHRIVRHMLASWDYSPGTDVIDRALAAAGGNMREALFALYDLYEARRATPPG